MANRQARMADAEKALDEAIRSTGITLHQAEARIRSQAEGGLQLVQLRVKVPLEPGEEYLTIVKAMTDTTGLVAFHGAGTLAEAITGGLRRFYNGSLKWKEDEYA